MEHVPALLSLPDAIILLQLSAGLQLSLSVSLSVSVPVSVPKPMLLQLSVSKRPLLFALAMLELRSVTVR